MVRIKGSKRFVPLSYSWEVVIAVEAILPNIIVDAQESEAR